MNRTVTLGRYALEWERDGYKPLPVNWYQDGFCVPELPDEIEDELYEKACAEVDEELSALYPDPQPSPKLGRCIFSSRYEPSEYAPYQEPSDPDGDESRE